MLQAKTISVTIGNNALESLKEYIETTGDTKIDFKDTKILQYYHEKLAKLIVFHGMQPFNIEDPDDKAKLNYYKSVLLQPKPNNITDYVALLQKRFPPETVLILDESLVKSRLRDSKRSVVRVIGYNTQNGVLLLRKYFESRLQPIHFKKHGFDSNKLYSLLEISFTSLFNNEIVLDFPREEDEKLLLDILFSEKHRMPKKA